VSDSDAGEIIAKDIVHADDVIAQFSMCIGNDCVNGENFGFDTLRLKENNLQIHFDDTSASASFPLNDWRIVANDTANGGASYLAFEDSTAGRQVFRVEAGARSNALYVDSGGDVGIGTSAPVAALHAKTGNTPATRRAFSFATRPTARPFRFGSRPDPQARVCGSNRLASKSTPRSLPCPTST
jgi:hypothetical protein